MPPSILNPIPNNAFTVLKIQITKIQLDGELATVVCAWRSQPAIPDLHFCMPFKSLSRALARSIDNIGWAGVRLLRLLLTSAGAGAAVAVAIAAGAIQFVIYIHI